MKYYEEFRMGLVHQMKVNKLSRKKVAELSGVTASMVSMISTGNRNASIDAMWSIANVFNRTPEQIMAIGRGETETPKNPPLSVTSYNDDLLGDILHDLILGRLNMSFEEFAKKCEISETELDLIISSSKPPSWGLLKKMFCELGINVNFLLAGPREERIGAQPDWWPNKIIPRLAAILGLERNDEYTVLNELNTDIDTVRKQLREKEITKSSLDEALTIDDDPLVTVLYDTFVDNGINPAYILGGSLPSHITKGMVEDETIEIKYFPTVYASAGTGVINYDESVSAMTFEKDFLVSQFGIKNFTNIHIINAIGDSMKPTIDPGDLLFINPGETELISGGIFCVWVDGNILVKRIEYNPITRAIKLLSDNSKYDPISLDDYMNTDIFRVVGKVMGNFKKV